MPNLFEPDFDVSEDRPGFTSRRARLGHQAGAERLGASVYELPPGQAPFPLHYHLGNEEMLIVLRGRPSLRTPAEERGLAEGEVVAFPAAGKLSAFGRPPGGVGDGIHKVFFDRDEAAFWEGEEPPPPRSR